MSILTRPRLLPQERFDLEDLSALLSAARTDSKLYTKEFLSGQNYVLKGFQITGLGLKSATVLMADATLIMPQNSTDFSWFTAAPAEPNIIVPDSDLSDGARNYLEISLLNQNNTPLTRAFWDPEANSGAGAEFNQIVETITDLQVKIVVSTGGFSGSIDRLPLAIIDVDGSGNIKTILDRRNLFFRLSTPTNIHSGYSWTSREEPLYSLVLSGVSGTFVNGEEITIGTETATVKVGGTTSITFKEPTGDGFFPGDSVIGTTSGATGTISTVSESFSGADKSIGNQRDILAALMNEIRFIKNTKYWYEDGGSSLGGLAATVNSLMVQAVIGASFKWDGTSMFIKDTTIVSPQDTDVLAYIRLLGNANDFAMTRQDGTGGSSPITVNEKQVVYVKLPASGGASYDQIGAGTSNYQVANIATFVPSDNNYWIAYRELNRLYIRGYGELEIGEEVIINDPMKENLQAEIDAINAALEQPVYEENVAIGAGGITSGSTLTLPVNTRISGSPQQFYVVGKGGLELYLNGQKLAPGITNGWQELGSNGAQSSTIQINQNLIQDDELTYRINGSGGPAAGSGGSSPAGDFNTLAATSVADPADFVCIFDVSLNSYRKMTRSDFLAGLNGTVPVNSYGSNQSLTNLNGVVLVTATATMLLPAPSTMTGRRFEIKNVGVGTMTIDGNGVNIDNMATIVSSTQFESFTVYSDGTKYWLL